MNARTSLECNLLRINEEKKSILIKDLDWTGRYIQKKNNTNDKENIKKTKEIPITTTT